MPDTPDRTAPLPSGTAETSPSSSPTRPPPGDSAPPQNAQAIRLDIQRTRSRMSRTLDEIEGRIAQRGEEVWSKLTLQEVRDAVTTDPWRNLLIAFVAGYVVAALRD